MGNFNPDAVGSEADKLIAKAAEGSDINPEDLELGNDLPEDDPPPDGGDPEDFEHKYKVLQGKYNAEVGRLTEALSSALMDKERLSSRPPSDPARQAVEGRVDELEDKIKYIREEYPNLADGIDALMDRKLNAALDAKLRPLQTSVASVTAGQVRSDREKYFEDLDRTLKGWRDINKSPKFLKWLEEEDRYTGQPRAALIRGAFDSFNTKATMAFFEDFAKESGMDIVLEGGAPQMEVHKKKSEDRFDITPNTGGGRIDPKGQKGNFVSRDEIETFYKDRAMGRFAGTEEEAAKIEGRLLKAVQEGRVR